MKKLAATATTKLRVNRETLRTLSQVETQQAVGGSAVSNGGPKACASGLISCVHSGPDTQ